MIYAKSEKCDVICENEVSKNHRTFAIRFKSIIKMNIKSIITIATACSGGADCVECQQRHQRRGCRLQAFGARWQVFQPEPVD